LYIIYRIGDPLHGVPQYRHILIEKIYFLFCSGDPKRNKTWILVDFLVKSGFYHLDRVVGMDGHYIPRVVREHTNFSNCQVLNLDNLFWWGQTSYRKVCSNKRTNAAPLHSVYSALLFVFGSN
jgi:hypothetical protein